MATVGCACLRLVGWLCVGGVGKKGVGRVEKVRVTCNVLGKDEEATGMAHGKYGATFDGA